MKTNRFASIFTFSFLLMATACQKEASLLPAPDPLEQFIGHWDNINENTDDITKVIITRVEANQLSIRVLRFCRPDFCLWGNFSATIEEARDGKIEVFKQGPGQNTLQQLSLEANGKLVLVHQTAPGGDPQIGEETIYFSKIKSISLYHQITQTDLIGTALLRTRVSGSLNETNQLTPGTILIFQTNAGRKGKIQVRGNSTRFTIRWESWNPDGTVFASSDFLSVKEQRYYDLNIGKEYLSFSDCESDFRWIQKDNIDRWIMPLCSAAFSIYHLE